MPNDCHSNAESVNYVPFATAHTFTNTEFIEAWRWSKDKNKQTWITHDLVYVFVNKGIDGDLTRAKAENFVTISNLNLLMIIHLSSS